MRIFSYRNKQRAKILLLVLGAAVLVYGIFVLCRFIYLQRFLVYTDSEVQLNYEQDLQASRPTEAPLSPDAFPVQIVTDDDTLSVGSQSEGVLTSLSGYYLSTTMLLNLPAVEEALDALEETPHALLFEMKSIFGNFYYASDLPGAITSSADIDGIMDLIRKYSNTGRTYMIARIPAFTDNNFALDNQSSGLPMRSGALWMDDNGCYWLDPMDEDVQDYLISIATELAEMGFDEIVFDGFYIPDSKNIVYDSGELTREGVSAEAAKTICSALESLPVRISFGSEYPSVAQYSDRVYLTTDNGGAVEGLVASVSEHLTDPMTQIVFQTASRDTRFDGYSILRPLIEKTVSDE